MKRKVITSKSGITIQKAAEILVRHHIGTLPIVDDSMHLIGLVTLHDLITPAIPDFYSLVEDSRLGHDFVPEDNNLQGFLHSPIEKIPRKPILVEENCG